jgi:carbamoyltransferase
MIILGINAFHGDSSACLVRDGRLVAAVEEERYRRVKHWAGFPSESIKSCLKQAGLGIADVDHVALNQDSKANILRKVAYVARRRPDLSLVTDRLRNRRARAGIEDLLAQAFPGERIRAKVHSVEHHIAHLSSAFHVSPFQDAAAVSVDGFGDFASAAWGAGHGTRIDVDARVYFPHSLGVLYQAVTQYLGFPYYGDEYKVMGLAPYGKPTFLAALRKLVNLEVNGGYSLNLDYFRHHREEVAYEWEDGMPEVGDLFSPGLLELLGPRRAKDEPVLQRHMDIAHSVQALYEEAFFHLLTTLQARHKLTDIVLAGGCAANSVANGKIRRQTPFRRVYVQAAAGDAGGALGAAFTVWHQLGGVRSFVMDHAYWGDAFSPEQIAAALANAAERIAQAGCEPVRLEPAELVRRTAHAVANGQVVGWFQGRMEWGPRALGNRSIVCDPRRADMKDILNAKIKRRESFRPFAPSVLSESVAEWFEEDDDVPFMMQVFQIREERRATIPAVTHVDGSGRLQTVHQTTNPLYHALISEFHALTGVPLVLNTSFNENEPVVCTPEQALDCFLRTNMDVLVLGDTMLSRNASVA